MTRKETIQEMLTESPGDAFLIYALALEEQKDGNIQVAIEQLVRLQNDQPDYLGTYYQLGKLYEQDQDPEKAIAIYKQGIIAAKQAKADKIWRELSEALLQLEDPDF